MVCLRPPCSFTCFIRSNRRGYTRTVCKLRSSGIIKTRLKGKAQRLYALAQHCETGMRKISSNLLFAIANGANFAQHRCANFGIRSTHNMKKILVLAFALALAPFAMAKSPSFSAKGPSAKSSHAKPHSSTSRHKAKPHSHKRTAKPHGNKAATHK